MVQSTVADASKLKRKVRNMSHLGKCERTLRVPSDHNNSFKE